MNTARHALTLEQVRIFLAERELLHVEATIAPGDVLTVMGPSGSGKSTLLALLAGFLAAPFVPKAVYGWASANSPLPAERRGIGLLFQDPLLFPHLSVAGNLRFGLPGRSPHPGTGGPCAGSGRAGRLRSA